jgi:hypothetical protein
MFVRELSDHCLSKIGTIRADLFCVKSISLQASLNKSARLRLGRIAQEGGGVDGFAEGSCRCGFGRLFRRQWLRMCRLAA